LIGQTKWALYQDTKNLELLPKYSVKIQKTRKWWALRVLIELAQYLSHMYSIFLDLAPILVNWSDIWEFLIINLFFYP